MTPPDRGSVIRYAYLWADEDRRGQTEDRKDRPAVVIAISVRKESGQHDVVAVAVTHSPPRRIEDAVPLPSSIRNRLGLDAEPAWAVTTEANAFTWPGPDIRFVTRQGRNSPICGRIRDDLLKRIVESYLANAKQRRTRIVPRSS